jgi:hypothetical protein
MKKKIAHNGFRVKHPLYGIWHISYEAVEKSYRDFLIEQGDTDIKIEKDDVNTWFNENILWCDVLCLGKQVDRLTVAEMREYF